MVARTDTLKPETHKPETLKPETNKTETSKTEVPKPEPKSTDSKHHDVVRPAKPPEGRAAESRPGDSKERNRLLDAALSQIEKDHGKGSILRLGKAEAYPIEGVSTGCLSLDLALGGVGVPRGRVVELYGPESSGKATP